MTHILQVLAGLNPCFPSVSLNYDLSLASLSICHSSVCATGDHLQSAERDGCPMGEHKQAPAHSCEIHQGCYQFRRHCLCPLVSKDCNCFQKFNSRHFILHERKASLFVAELWNLTSNFECGLMWTVTRDNHALLRASLPTSCMRETGHCSMPWVMSSQSEV